MSNNDLQLRLRGTERRTSVAALFVDRTGPYFTIDAVDPWDAKRDARKYDGPWPVVAHPPCGPWGALRHLHVPHRERRDDADCGPIAVAQVRKYGGVLEQPKGSKLWDVCSIPKPGEPADAHGGFSIEVAQVEWGHPARKKTWLYLVGIASPDVAPPFPGRAPTHWVSGGRVHTRKGSGGVVPPGIKVCSAQQRRRTPRAFALWLVDLARTARAA